ncbi:FAD-binding protein [Curtobacterium sp. MCBD17_032]|uniref:FAD-binding protein n=1 Tax=Curtobacterium sp. MCBD17_032 TaxID=2175659 RepID=UPI000DA98A00|nr:D-arabinono-1,4-lactone oxidase [Curtobacterium sp. MCBD17_032]PZE85230.1 FAD-binding protein [Curtobacterium sp. MCBD17_032]
MSDVITDDTSAAVRTNWSGNVTYSASRLAEPTTVAELQQLVASTPRLTALGSRHSFNTIADTDAVQVTLTGLPPELDVDGERRVARVAAGLTHAQVAVGLEARGWALANLASLPHISVAGAVATGTHGSGVGNASLAQSVVGVEIVRASGEIEVVGADDPRLDAHRVALGALGVVVAVHLAIEPTYRVAQTVHTGLGWDVVDAQFEQIMSAGYSVSMFTGYTADGIRQIWTKRREDRDDAAVDLAALGAVAGAEPIHPVPGSETAGVTEQGGVPGPWHERLPHFRSSFTPSAGEEIQAEYMVAATDAVPAIQALRGIGEAIAPVLFVSEIRRIAADDAWLAPSSGQDSVAFHFTFRRQTEDVAVALPLIENALAPFAPRPHWGKVTASTPERLHQVYPQLGAFAALARDLDPQGRFRNPFLERVLG